MTVHFSSHFPHKPHYVAGAPSMINDSSSYDVISLLAYLVSAIKMYRIWSYESCCIVRYMGYLHFFVYFIYFKSMKNE